MGERFIAACEQRVYRATTTTSLAIPWEPAITTKCVQGLAAKRQGGFLGPGHGSQNLTVCSEYLVDRCVISDGHVTGVLVRDKQNRQSLIEGRHVILAAGAIGSPPYCSAQVWVTPSTSSGVVFNLSSTARLWVRTCRIISARWWRRKPPRGHRVG